MTRKAFLAFAAAGAITAIVVLTTGAFAGTSTSTRSSSSDQSSGGTEFVSCLASHGVQVPSSDPADLKQWLGDHQSDPAVQAALQSCQQPDQSATDLTPAELATCLEQHGVDVPSDVTQDPGAFKQWLAGALDQPSVKAALDACTGGG